MLVTLVPGVGMGAGGAVGPAAQVSMLPLTGAGQ